MELAQLVLDDAKRVRLIGVARRAGGFHRCQAGNTAEASQRVKAAIALMQRETFLR